MLLATSWWIIMTTIMAGRIYVLTGSKQVWLLLIPLGCWLVCRGLTWHASQRGDVMGAFITFPLEVLAWPERRGNTLMEEVGDYRHTELGDAIYQAKQSVCVCLRHLHYIAALYRDIKAIKSTATVEFSRGEKRVFLFGDAPPRRSLRPKFSSLVPLGLVDVVESAN